jgi:hypothetical protein
MQREIIYKGSDVEAIFLNNIKIDKQKRLPVSFSSWSTTGVSQFFGESYFNNYNVNAILVRSLRNHWWHSIELVDIFNIVKTIDKELLLYGSSMGGYAALLFSGYLDAASISLSPQVSIFQPEVQSDIRWRCDWNSIKQEYDEKAFFEKKTNKIRLSFFDFMHEYDTLHRFLLESYSNSHNGSIKIIDVPFSNHTPVRVLNKSGLLKEILNSIIFNDYLDVYEIEFKCKIAYKHYPKSHIQYLRNFFTSLPIDEVKQIALSLYESADKKDFEFYYIAAEVFAKLGLCDIAVEASLRSLSMNIERDYLYVKHANILHECISASTALNYISKFKGTNNETELVKNFIKRLERLS